MAPQAPESHHSHEDSDVEESEEEEEEEEEEVGGSTGAAVVQERRSRGRWSLQPSPLYTSMHHPASPFAALPSSAHVRTG